jgi:hypothetical protein
MLSREENISRLPQTFTAKLRKSASKGGWTFVIWPESVQFFGTRGLVKVKDKIDGHPFESSFMALDNGIHKLSVKEGIRNAVGDTVEVLLEERSAVRDVADSQQSSLLACREALLARLARQSLRITPCKSVSIR